MRDPHTRSSRYIRALEQATIGRTWQRGVNPNVAGGMPFELARVAVPPSHARSWVVTWAPPPWARPVQQPEPPGWGGPEPQRIEHTYLQLRWGNGSTFALAEVDYRQGGCVTLYGSEVQVAFVSPNEFSGLTFAGLELTQLGAWITPGESHPNLPVTRTVYYPLTTDGTSNIQAVPRFARRWALYYEETIVTATVQFADNAGTNQVGQYASLTGPRDGGRFVPGDTLPVPADATSARITVFGGNATPRIMYELLI